MPYPAKLIAYAFVKRGIDEGRPVTQMKLQKMVFFAHGVHLAAFYTPLVQEDFEAWQFGPVVPSIYQEYKSFGSQPIKTTVEYPNSEKVYLDENAKAAIDYTWNATKNLSASTLSAWTHMKGSPWYEYYVPNVWSVQIDNSTIQKYFQQLLETANNARLQPA